MGKPDQFFILPDPQLRGAANVVSVTSETGPFAGPVVAESDNGGHLYPIQSGELAADAEDLVYRVQTSGGPGTAEFVWRRASDPTDEYRGKDDPRRVWRFTTPFTSSVPGADSNAAVYASKFRRIVVFGARDSTDTIYVRYRDVATFDDTAWTQVTFSAVNGIETFDHELQALELDDGALLLAVRLDDGPDFDIYRSDDGGDTWSLHSEKVVTRFAPDWGTGLAANQFRFARSGDHIRLVAVVNTDKLSTIVSTDRGVTWQHTGVNTQAVDDHGGNDDVHPIYIVPTDKTEDGEFILIAKTSAAETLEFYSSRGFDQWQQLAIGSHSIPTGLEARAFCAANDGTYIWQLIFGTAGAGDRGDNWTLRRYRLGSGNPFDAGDWEQVDDILVPSGWRHVPIRPQLVPTGDGLFLYAALGDQQSNYSEESHALAAYLDVWTRFSFGEAGPGEPLVDGTLFDFYWAAVFGQPAPVGDSQVSDDTAYNEITSGSPTVSYGSSDEDVAIITNASGEKQDFVHNMNATTAGHRTLPSTTGWAYETGGSSMGWVVQVGSGDGDSTTEFIRMRVDDTQSTGSTSNGVSFTIRLDDGAIRLHDENASTERAAFTTVDLTDRHEISVFVIDLGSSVVGYLYARNLITDEWFESGQFTLSETSTGPVNSCNWGHNTQPDSASHVSEWFEHWIAVGKDVRRNGPTNPDDLLGATASSRPQYVDRGIEVAWVGAGGVIGDEFTGEVRHAFPVEAALFRSPRIAWRSSSVAGQTIVLDADPTNGAGRFFHDAAAVFGITDGSVIIDYDDNTAFSSPVGGDTLEPKVYTGLSVGSVRGNTVFLNATAPQVGEAVDLVAEFTSGGAAGTRMLCTAQHDRGLGSQLVFGDELDLAGLGVGGGDTFDLYETHAATKYSGGAVDGQRYMRLRFLDGDTHTDDHRLGTLVAGHALDIDVPLDWSWTDNEQPNVTRYQSRGAVQWAYEEGPAQRTVIGRIVGDGQRWRQKLRDLLRSLARYEVDPCVLVLDDQRVDQTAILGTVQSGSQHDNAAWYVDASGDLRTAGDQSITFVEEV